MIKFFSFFRLDLNRAIEPVEITFLRCDRKERLRRLLSAFYTNFRLEFPIKKLVQPGEAEYYFLKSMARPDYDTLYYKIVDCCSASKTSYDIRERRGSLSFMQAAYLFICAPFIFKLYRRNFIQWMFLYLSFVKLFAQFKHLPPLKRAHLVVFADMQPLDNLAVQYAVMQGNDTTTLQHGLYVDYARQKNVNAVNYLNTNAANFLAWGEDTAELIVKYHPSKNIFICGKPTLAYPTVSAEVSEPYFTVVFDQNIFFSFNIELLNIAYKLSSTIGLKVNLRLHPNNRLQWFKVEPEKTLINQSVWNSKFVIGHTSSLIYECMRVGIPAFRYDTSVPSLTTPEELQFSEFDQLAHLVDYLPARSEALSERYILLIDQQSAEEYARYFSGHKSPASLVL